MKKRAVILGGVVVALIVVAILWKISFFSSHPLTPIVSVNKMNIPVTEGTYCWSGLLSGSCVDKAFASPWEMGHEQEPAEVSPKQYMTLFFDKKPQKGSLSVFQYTGDKESTPVHVRDGIITLPSKKGTYVYSISAHWEQGDGHYTVIIKVK